MPELPEVETTRRGLAPHLVGRRVTGVVVRQPQLRWPVAAQISTLLPGQRIDSLQRRAKYLLVGTAAGSAMLHLGMSGMLRVVPHDTPVGRHDHIDWLLDSGLLLRYTDPRRFGSQLWQAPGSIHPLLANLGPEPLGDAFSGDYLWRQSRGRKVAVKIWLMNQSVVVGVGNIYAAEALFQAGIHPTRAAGRISRERYRHLAAAVQQILADAIIRGGTTLRDFLAPDGAPGYFAQELSVYGRGGKACPRCAAPLRELRMAQRSTVYCPRCQR